MRNLKKVLALVLAMAMSLSLAVTAGAAFNDQDKIVNTEAVDMCVALNIINGRTDGSFDPAGNVTRAEMAKMICIVLNGGKEPATATKAVPTYADIDGHWAEGYIEYCSAKGVVAGVGGGNFNPNGSVTGSQAAKMLLVALGYNADVEKMVGANWELYTNVLANQDGLYNDLESMDPSAALSRDNAAQMIWNALNAETIEVTSSIDRNDGSIVDSYTKSGDDMLAVEYGAKEWVGTITGYTDQKAQFEPAEKYTTVDFEDYTEDDSDLIGKTVKVLYKENATGKDTIYGLFLDDENTYIETIAGKVTDYVAEKDTDPATVKVDGTKYKVSATGDALTAVSNAAAEKSANPVTVVVDKDGKVADVWVDAFDVVKVEFVGSKSILTNGADYTDLETVVADGIAKDDWAVVSYDEYADKTVLTKADIIEGEVEVVNGDYITIDGTKYTKANAKETTLADLDLGNTVKAVVVDGFIYNSEKVSGIGSLADVVYVSAAKVNDDYGTETVSAKATFADGTAAEIRVVALEGTYTNEDAIIDAIEGAKGNDALDGLWAFTLDGEKYTLKAISTGTNADFDAGEKSTTTAGDDKIGGLRVNADAVVFVEDKDGAVEVITGETVAAWQALTSGVTVDAYANETNGVAYVELAALVMTVDTPDAANDAIYGYITEVVGQTQKDNVTYHSYTVWTANGELPVTVKAANDISNTTLNSEGTFIKFENDKISALGTSYSALNGMAGDIVYFGNGATDFKITDDTQIIYIDAANEVGAEGGALQLAVDLDGDGNKDYNVLKDAKAAVDGVRELLYIFVDINNDIAGAL